MISLVTDYPLPHQFPRQDDFLQPLSLSGRVAMTVCLNRWEEIASQVLIFFMQMMR